MIHSPGGPNPGRIARVDGRGPVTSSTVLALLALPALLGFAMPARAQEPDTTQQRDIVDVARKVFGMKVPEPQFTVESRGGGLSTTLLPTIGIRPQTN